MSSRPTGPTSCTRHRTRRNVHLLRRRNGHTALCALRAPLVSHHPPHTHIRPVSHKFAPSEPTYRGGKIEFRMSSTLPSPLSDGAARRASATGWESPSTASGGSYSINVGGWAGRAILRTSAGLFPSSTVKHHQAHFSTLDAVTTHESHPPLSFLCCQYRWRRWIRRLWSGASERG